MRIRKSDVALRLLSNYAKMSRFKLLYFVISAVILTSSNAEISDKRLCVDADCTIPVSQAMTLLRYASPEEGILSFGPNVPVTVYSKPAGNRMDLWGVEINGKRGYVNYKMIRETKMLNKATILVDTGVAEAPQVPLDATVAPSKVQEPYEVVDGTTIYTSPSEKVPESTDQTAAQESVNVESSEPVTVATPISEEEDDVDEEDDDEFDDEDEDETSEELVAKSESVTQPEAIPTEDPLMITPDLSQTKVETVVSGTEVPLPTEESPKTDELSSSPTLETVPDQISIEDVPTPAENVDSQTIIQETVQETTPVQEVAPVQETVVISDIVPEIPIPIPTIEEPLLVNNEIPEFVQESEVVTLQDSAGNPVEETTTIVPELEIPTPQVDNILPEVTSDVPIIKESIPTLPPLGLFNNAKVIDAVPNIPAEVISEENLTIDYYPATASVESNADIDNKSDLVFQGEAYETVKHFEDTPIDSAVKNMNVDAIQENNYSEIDLVSESKPNDAAEEESVDESPGLFSGLFSFFDKAPEETVEEKLNDAEKFLNLDQRNQDSIEKEQQIVPQSEELTVDHQEIAKPVVETEPDSTMELDFFAQIINSINSDRFMYLVTTAVSVIIFLFGYIILDKMQREGPLVAKINKLERELLVTIKENQLLQDKVSEDSNQAQVDNVVSERVDILQEELAEMATVKSALEDQIQSLEKELENSTDVGMELNRMLSEVLSSAGDSDVLKVNVEHLQRQLVDQQSTINSINGRLAESETENQDLRTELNTNSSKVQELQAEIDKLLFNLIKLEEEKDQQLGTVESELSAVRNKCEEINEKNRLKEQEVQGLKNELKQTIKLLEIKTKEQEVLSATTKKIKSLKNEDFKSLLDLSEIKAEVEVLRAENVSYSEKLAQIEELKEMYEKRAQERSQEVEILREKYDVIDRLKVETETKLEVLTNYFKEKETQLQKEISKHESMWVEKQGEATSTTERIKFMQEQLQNYKAQTDSLKQEIISQEVELKSQISVLEKKCHENWVTGRQAERKIEDAKQEAAQLRHRLTLRERSLQEEKGHSLRYQSPIEQNGEIPISPHETPVSPPLIYGAREMMTKSPPIPGMPPFMPPFMPPPMHGVPPFIPAPPVMFPGDHRPPPLGRMSSPPLNSRYSPSSRGYSPYDRNSSSPSDSEYGTSPPHRPRGYSPFNNREDRRDYKRPPPGRSNGRNLKGSSGSGNSNESLDRIHKRQQSKV